MKKIIVISTIFFLFFSCDSKSVNIYEIELPNETIDNKKFNINDYKNSDFKVIVDEFVDTFEKSKKKKVTKKQDTALELFMSAA